MAEAVKYERFKENLRNGNIEGVTENLEADFVEKVFVEEYKKRPIHYACQYGDIEIVKLLIEKKCDIEAEDYKGWRPIHYACCYGYIKIAKLLIEKKCNIESETNDKWRPIHHACWKGYNDIMKLLILHNCLIDVIDCERRTPLDLAKMMGNEGIIKLISELLKVTKEINDSILNNDHKSFAKYYKSDILTGKAWLEMAFDQKADKIIKCFLNRSIDDSEILYINTVLKYDPTETKDSQLWEEVLFYKCIKGYHDGFQIMCKATVINRQNKMIPCSILEVAAENGNCVFVQEILRKSIYDSEIWKRAKKISLQNHHQKVHDAISNREYLLKCRQKNNISILHTAICDNDPDMMKYILSQGLVNDNHNHETFGTPLAFAIMLCHHECLKVLEQIETACNTQNKYLQSPLHEAVSNGMIEHCQSLMNNVKNIDQPGFMEQTALHCAVMRGCEELCDQLVKLGADCTRYMTFSQHFTEKKGTPTWKGPLHLSQRENSLTLCLKINKTIYACFLQSLDKNKANSSDDEGNSLLHLSVDLLKPELCHALIKAGANVDSLNNEENTPLYELLSNLNQQSFATNEEKVIEIVNLFVQSGCDLNKSLKRSLSLFYVISKLNSESLALSLLPRQQTRLYEIDENLFIISLDMHFFRFCESLLDLFPKDSLKSSITTNVIKTAVQNDCTKLLKSLVMKAFEDVQQIVTELSLYHLAKLVDKDSFECLLNIEIKNPLLFENGESLLTMSLKEKKLDFCQMIIESKLNKKKYINFKNKTNQTPLQISIEIESMDIVQHLIFETESIDNEDSEGRTALMQLFMKISHNDEKDRRSLYIYAIKSLISQGGNIYHEASTSKKVIDYCCSPTLKEDIETLFQKKQEKNTVGEKIVEKEKIVLIKEIKSEKNICGICLDREVDSVYKCGHTICQICSEKIVQCPFCKFEPARAKRIYFN